MAEIELRRNLIGLAQTLASPKAQLEYQRNVPNANVPAELVCQWFDDLYHPASEVFQQSFTPDEQDRLAAFNEFYLVRKDQLPKSLAEIHRSLQWHEVVDEAARVLNDLKWSEGS